MREEGRGFKGVHNQMGEAEPLNLLNMAAWLISTCFLLALGRLCPSSVRPRSMCVHAKARTRNQQISNGRKRCKEHMKEA